MSLSDLLLIIPLDPLLDGDGHFVGVFKGVGTNADPDDDGVVFDVFNDASFVDKDGTTDDCLPTDFFFFFLRCISVTPTRLFLPSYVCFLSNLLPQGVSIVLPTVRLVAPCAMCFCFLHGMNRVFNLDWVWKSEYFSFSCLTINILVDLFPPPEG